MKGKNQSATHGKERCHARTVTPHPRIVLAHGDRIAVFRPRDPGFVFDTLVRTAEAFQESDSLPALPAAPGSNYEHVRNLPPPAPRSNYEHVRNLDAAPTISPPSAREPGSAPASASRRTRSAAAPPRQTRSRASISNPRRPAA
jgi:hypothetical protein